MVSGSRSEVNTEPNFLVDAQIVLVSPPKKRNTEALSLQGRNSSPDAREEEEALNASTPKTPKQEQDIDPGYAKSHNSGESEDANGNSEAIYFNLQRVKQG